MGDFFMGYKLVNRIISRDDSQAIMDSLRLRYNTLGQNIYDINLVLDELLNNDCVIISTYIGKFVVASAYIKTLQLDDGEEVLLLDYIFVRKELRNKGIGTQLLCHVLFSKQTLNSIFNTDCKRIVLKPYCKDNKKLYSKTGFEDIDDEFMGRRI